MFQDKVGIIKSLLLTEWRCHFAYLAQWSILPCFPYLYIFIVHVYTHIAIAISEYHQKRIWANQNVKHIEIHFFFTSQVTFIGDKSSGRLQSLISSLLLFVSCADCYSFVGLFLSAEIPVGIHWPVTFNV